MSADLNQDLSDRLSLFSLFSKEKSKSVLATLRRRKFNKGQVIIHHLSEENDVFFLLSGRALAFLTAIDGTELAFDEIPRGSYFGELAAIDGGPRSASVCALTDVEVVQVSSEEFLQMIETYPEFALALLRDFTTSVRSLSNRNFELATKPVSQRVKSLIVREALERDQLVAGGVIKPALTHAEIARRIGARREAVSRSLSEMVNQGMIETRRQTIIINSPEDLVGSDD